MDHKRTIPTAILLGLSLLLSSVPSFAQSVSATGLQFLQVPEGVRASGMAGAFTALADDGEASYWNPAGLSQLTLPEIDLSHLSYFQGIHYEFLGAALPLAPGSVLGLSADLDGVDAFNSTGDPSATPGSASDWDLGFQWGQAFGRNFALGLGAKFISSSLVSYGATGQAFDAGLLVTTDRRDLALGLSVANLGQVSAYDSFSTPQKLPTTYRAGLAYRFAPGEPDRFSVDVDLEKTIDQDPILHAGGEFWMDFQGLSLALRGGYSLNPLNDGLGGATGASVGAGLRLASFEFEYALVPYGALGDTNEFSLTYRFEPAPTPVTAQAAGPQRPAVLDITPQLADYKTGSVRQATFEIKPQARTEIKDWTLEIRDPSGNLVRTYQGQGVPPKQIAWDGKDNYGHVVPQGIFSNYDFKTEDMKGQQTVSSNPLFQVQGTEAARITPGVMTPQLAAILAQRQPEPVYLPTVPQPLVPAGPTGQLRMPAVGFPAGSSGLDPAYAIYLDQVVEAIRRYPNARVYIEGHAAKDDRVKDALQLSQDRADAVLRYLVEKGKVDPGNLYARGHGLSPDTDETPGEALHFSTRDVDIIILTK